MFTVRVTPRAGSDSVDGVDDQGVLHVRVRSAPADGAANKALIKTLSDELDVAPSLIEIACGTTSRVKRVSVYTDRGTIERQWPGLLTSGG